MEFSISKVESFAQSANRNKKGTKRRQKEERNEKNGSEESNRPVNQLETVEENVGTQVASFRHVRPGKIFKRAFGFERFVVSSIKKIATNPI